MKGEWSPNWRLESIPFSAIPDDLLKSWWAKRNAIKRGKKQVDDPKRREFLDKRAAYMRGLRSIARLKRRPKCL